MIFTRESSKYFEGYEFEVIVMAIVGKWAMVRRKGASPFIASTRELKEIVV